MLNSSDPNKVLFNAEEKLRILSKIGRGLCCVLGVFDCCRLNSDFKSIKSLIDEEKKKANA